MELNIFENIDFNSKLETNKKITKQEAVNGFGNELLEIPKPSNVRISTMTATCTLVSNETASPTQINVDLKSIYENIEINEKDGPIIGISLGELPVRGFDKGKNRKKRKKIAESSNDSKKKKRRKFFNQTTLLI